MMPPATRGRSHEDTETITEDPGKARGNRRERAARADVLPARIYVWTYDLIYPMLSPGRRIPNGDRQEYPHMV